MDRYFVSDAITRNPIFHFFTLKFNQFRQFNNLIANGNMDSNYYNRFSLVIHLLVILMNLVSNNM